MAHPTGQLFIVATPIGNLEDITLRALRVLKEVDLIAAEDTRVTRKLLAHFEIPTPMTSYFEHNEVVRGKELIEAMKAGKRIALVSDAGMPGISDPGHRLIASCIAEGITVEPVPGPSSLVTALVVSGLPTDSFVFHGFLPRKKGERATVLDGLLALPYTIVLFESARRVAATLEHVAQTDPSRRAVVARELTKKFEEVLRGTASELLERIGDTGIKGEVVLLFGPAEESAHEASQADLRQAVVDLVGAGMRKKDAIAEVAKRFGISKRVVYEAVMDIHEKNLAR